MNIAFELHKAAMGVEEWRVADPETGCYCIAFSHGNSLNPQRAATGWLEDHRERFPGSQHAHYEVQRVMAQDQTDDLMNAAADEIDRLRYALKIAAKTFGEYADIHAAKTPPDENKVRRNENLRDLCNEALTHNARGNSALACKRPS